MPVVVVHSDDPNDRELVIESLKGVFPKEQWGNIVVEHLQSQPVTLSGESAPYAVVSASTDCDLRTVRTAGAAVVDLMDVEVYRPNEGTKDYYQKGQEVPIPKADTSRGFPPHQRSTIKQE